MITTEGPTEVYPLNVLKMDIYPHSHLRGFGEIKKIAMRSIKTHF